MNVVQMSNKIGGIIMKELAIEEKAKRYDEKS